MTTAKSSSPRVAWSRCSLFSVYLTFPSTFLPVSHASLSVVSAQLSSSVVVCSYPWRVVLSVRHCIFNDLCSRNSLMIRKSLRRVWNSWSKHCRLWKSSIQLCLLLVVAYCLLSWQILSMIQSQYQMPSHHLLPPRYCMASLLFRRIPKYSSTCADLARY